MNLNATPKEVKGKGKGKAMGEAKGVVVVGEGGATGRAKECMSCVVVTLASLVVLFPAAGAREQANGCGAGVLCEEKARSGPCARVRRLVVGGAKGGEARLARRA